ncbi:S-adenosyl-L-methionine-dependent methyltransferase [Lipomyces japonicus]|uniref:S-adenosyl-L-methionine-dependent methyltransferase n=1 Tax=Lipomyces japonicus TaxID=56871 RepID=UPI0034CD6767
MRILSTLLNQNIYRQMGRRGRNGPPRPRDGHTGWVDIEKKNNAFEQFYKAQGILPEDEWEKFYDACKATLPVTFRITGSSQHATNIRDTLANEYVPFLKNIVWEGEEVEPPTPLPWYPDSLAWQIRVGKTVIRKSKPFARFQRFLVVETDVGNISRQEAVSMIPPLLLDVKPEHAVIDLCAAPGSKTAQLIEAVHAIPEPTGIVVANDSDHKRSHMLIHQVKRLNSPNLVVTNHDAQLFPRIRIDQESYLKYDRVLCDVPCSGDGTMRKNINVWRDWNSHNGLALHNTQLNILNRGLHLLKQGGKLVYSTCSLNPVENEAVVAAAIRQWKGKVKIVDASNLLPGLVRRPGVLSWKVMGKDKKWKNEPEGNIPATAFHKGDEKELGVQHCMRVYPHDQDTGGFFITLLEKVDEEELSKKRPAAEEVANEVVEKKPKLDNVSIETESTTETGDVAPQPERAPIEKKIRLPRDANEEPFKFLNESNPALETCWKFYSISPSFPRDSTLVRNATGEPIRTIYYVHPRLKPIISLNDTKIRFIHAGIKLFANQKTLEGTCPWRVQSEGMSILYKYIDKTQKGADKVRIVRCELDTLEDLCKTTFPKIHELTNESFKEEILALKEGCVFLQVTYGSEELVFPLWRGFASVNLMLPKQETAELLHRVFKVENVKTSDVAKKEDPKEQPTEEPKVISEVQQSDSTVEAATIDATKE